MFFSFTMILGLQAHSIVELRGNYSLLTSSPDLVALYSGAASNVPSIAPTVGLGADLIISLPLMPFGFGVRYENQAIEASTAALKMETSFTRTSLLLNWRLIDTLLFVGPIFTYGLSDSTNLKFSAAGVPVSNYTAGSTTSYSIGLEAGVKLLTFLVGAEVGMMDYRWKDSRDSVGTVSGNKDINMSGSYAKVLFGFKI